MTTLRKIARCYGKLLKVEIIFALGWFGGCAFTGFLVGLGRLHH
jgi:hypothetical protein